MRQSHPATRRTRREETAHAGRQAPRPPAPDAADRWLRGFPDETHATVEGWFRHVIQKGTRDLDTIVRDVTVLVGQKLDWSTTSASRQLCNNTLVALRADMDGAREFAQAVLDKTTQPTTIRSDP